MVAYWLWTSQKVGSHFANSEQVKDLVVILLSFSESKNFVVIFADFEQIEKLVLLKLDGVNWFSDGYFSYGCFLYGCFFDHSFLDDCFLNGCLLTLNKSKT